MLTKNLESVLWVLLEGLIDDCHKIINEAIGIWKNNTKFRYLFFHPERYLCVVVVICAWNINYRIGRYLY